MAEVIIKWELQRIKDDQEQPGSEVWLYSIIITIIYTLQAIQKENKNGFEAVTLLRSYQMSYDVSLVRSKLVELTG